MIRSMDVKIRKGIFFFYNKFEEAYAIIMQKMGILSN